MRQGRECKGEFYKGAGELLARAPTTVRAELPHSYRALLVYALETRE